MHHTISFDNSQVTGPAKPRNNQPGRKGVLRSAFGLALLVGFGLPIAPALASSTLVSAPDGTFQGKIDSTGTLREFLGVRYAQPFNPSMRWKPPQPLAPSVTTQDATRFGNHCPQPFSTFGNATQTEDCLFLNVYTPNDDRRDDPRPVMVWIHGGALLFGAGNDYNPIKLVQRGVIVVTINYRLGALGFLAHPALRGESSDQTSGNYGIADQQAALRWVQRNISAFGGDAGIVTIFGESAGGLSTLVNMISPTAAGLFHRAIVQSGAYQLTLPAMSVGDAAGVTFASAVGCTQPDPADLLACLRSISVSAIFAHQSQTPAPKVDGKMVPQSISDALGSGQFNRVPLMNGTNHAEGNFFVAGTYDLRGGPVTASTYVAAIADTIGNAAVAPTVAANYPVPAQFPTYDQGVGAVRGDKSFTCGARFADELASPFVTTFAYEFNDDSAPQNFLPPVTFPYGATHTSELQYLFPIANPSGIGLNLAQVPLNAAQQKLSDQMVGYWTQFARGGNPNGHGQPVWQPFDRSRQVMLSLVEPTPTRETDFATRHQCDFWDAFLGRALPPSRD